MASAAANGVNWFVWRIVFSPDVPDSLAEIKTWGFQDLLAAHFALDAIEEVRDLRAEEAARQRRTGIL